MKKLAALIAVLVVGTFTFILACQPKAAVNAETATAAAAEPEPTPPAVTNNEPITIAAVGDIMMGSPFPNDSRMPPNDGADLFKEVTPILSAADIAFGNLEGPIIDNGVSAKCPPRSTRCFAFRMPTRYGKYLKNAGFDVMSVANNHAGDFGEAGRASTQKVLTEQGIKYAGSLQPAAVTAFLDVKGKKVGFIAFGHNNGMPSINDLDNARKLVADLKKRSNIVIVSFHGGGEGTDRQHVPNGTEIFLGENRGNLRAFTHTVVDAGADIVLGHGPHVMRGMELYNDRLIVYSMGNFCTYGWFGLAAETALGKIVEAKIAADGKFISGKINATKQEGRGGPLLDSAGTAIRVVRNLSTADFGANAPKIADDGTFTKE
ncbi:MAG: CapA family protein [Chloracidobacterium sp.]|nr:CapA family protein [Chloracidobacterium sp.]MCO5333692.1 CapA family protein [Pyrinomonadaceae bacterium]